MEYEVGDRILGRLEVRDLKRGGMGVVYIVYDHKFNWAHALKSFQDQYFYRGDKRADKIVKGFYREAETWIRLGKHRNIVEAFFVYQIDNKPHVFLEYVDGGNLLDWISIGLVHIPQSLDFAIQFCDGMIYSNSKDLGEGRRGIVHRDIKPANIMFTKDHVLKITDFGLVKALGAPTAETPMGTPEYMSPEQFRTMDVDQRSDIYSFGVVMYEMLTGRPPFYTEIEEERWNHCKRHHQETPPKPPRGVNPLVPEELEQVVLRCLAKHPENRYQCFEKLRGDLMEIYRSLFGERPEIRERIETLTAEAWLNKGISFHELGRYEDALRCFDKALELNPKLVWAWLNKGASLYSLGKYEEAIWCCNQALNIDPGLAGAWKGIGTSLVELGRPEEALECFDKALEKDPGHVDAWLRKGAVLVGLGRLRDAVWCYDEAIEMNPRYADAWDYKGTALFGLGSYEEALQCSKKALELNPMSASAWANVGYSLFRLGRVDEAMKCCDRAIELDPGLALPVPVSAAWLCKGLALTSLGRIDEGLQCIDKALEIYPKLAEAWNAKGAILAALGRHEEAVRCLDKALEINPRRADAWGGKGLSLFELGRFEEALECFDKALEINPRDENARRLKELILRELQRAWRDFVKDDVDF